MRSGGIFNSKDALGTDGLGGTSTSCVLGTGLSNQFTKTLQNELRYRGATKLGSDGIYGGCTESAFQKVTGSPISKASLENFLGVTCSYFTKAGAIKPCTNGSDEIVDLTPTEEIVGMTTTTTPQPATPSSTYVKQTVSAYKGPTVSMAAAKKTLVPGVPDAALAIGGLVLVAGALAIIAAKKKEAQS